MKKSLVVILTIAVLLFAFSGLAVANEREDAAQRLLSFGVIEGFPDGSLGLERDITRAEFARIVVLARGLGDAAEVLQGTQTTFSDVGAGLWFTGWINVASAQGIIMGYPDGTFRPNANISYAEAVTMVLRTLGYNDNLPGVWPHSYLVMGADLSITSGVFTNATDNAVRGSVFVMLNRAFDNYVVRWDPEALRFVEDTTLEGHTFTLLQWMLRARESVRGIVIDNLHTDTSLRDNEIVLRVTRTTIVDRDTIVRYDEDVFRLTGPDLDPNALLGLEVELFHNDSDVYFVNIRTADRDILIDILDAEVSRTDNSIALTNRDARVNLAPNARVVIFNASGEVDIRDAFRDDDNRTVIDRAIAEDSYGRFVLERGQIAFAWIFEGPQEFAGVVTNVNNNRVEYFAGEGDDRTLNLNDYDNVIVLDGQLRTGDVEQIDTDSVIYAWVNEDNELFLVTVNNVQEGTMTSANRSRVTVDGVNISVDRFSNGKGTTISDTNNEIVEWYYTGARGLSDLVDNLIGEEVVVARDLIGQARHIVGVTAGSSGLQYGIAVSSGGTRSIDIFTQEGNVVSYNFARGMSSSDFTAATGIANPLTSAQNYFSHFAVNDQDFVFVEFRVNRSGEVSYIRHLGTNSNPTNPTSTVVTNLRDVGNGSIVLTGNVTRFITSRTIIMGAPAGTRDEDDLEVIRWNSIAGQTPGGAEAIVWAPSTGNANDAAFIVFTGNFDNLSSDDNSFAVVHGAATQGGDRLWRMAMQVAGSQATSENVLVAAERGGNAIPRNSIIEFRLNSVDEARIVTNNTDVTRTFGGITLLRNWENTNVVVATYGNVFRVTQGGSNSVSLVPVDTPGATPIAVGIVTNAAIRSTTIDTSYNFSVGGPASINTGDHIIFIGPYDNVIGAAFVLPRGAAERERAIKELNNPERL